MQQAIEYEARRHIEVYESGGTIRQETRLFDSVKGETRSMRSKEQAHDYRYFPDPDLLPLVLDPKMVESIKASLPELPDEKKQRFIAQLGLSPYNAGVLVAEKEKAAFYETVLAQASGGKPNPKVAQDAANLVMGDYSAALNASGESVAQFKITAAMLAELLKLQAEDVISGRLAKDVFALMLETGKNPAAIVDEKGMRQVTDTGAIEAAIDQVMADNPDKVAEVRAGKDKLIGWFVGQVMKSTQGKANPAMLNELLAKRFQQ